MSSKGQNLSQFDTKLKTERLTLCEALTKYADVSKGFKYTTRGKSIYSILKEEESYPLYGNWTYTLINDSLYEYSYATIELPLTEEWYNKLYPRVDSTIKYFTQKYGKPIRDTLIKNKVNQKTKKTDNSFQQISMWIINGQKIKVFFGIVGEHNEYSYVFSIHRFQDYYYEFALPSWWDGF